MVCEGGLEGVKEKIIHSCCLLKNGKVGLFRTIVIAVGRPPAGLCSRREARGFNSECHEKWEFLAREQSRGQWTKTRGFRFKLT